LISFLVEGRPSPQGSKSPGRGGRFYEASKYLPAWRSAVSLAAKHEMMRLEMGEPIAEPLQLEVTFFIQKPKSSKWALYPAGTPDLSKLIRGVEDALTHAGLWADDALVVNVLARKRWTGVTSDTYPVPGCRITVTKL